MDILRRVQEYRQTQDALKWEGTFAEYLELLKEKPYLAQSEICYRVGGAALRKCHCVMITM